MRLFFYFQYFSCKAIGSAALLVFMAACQQNTSSEPAPAKNAASKTGDTGGIALAIHGGAGTIKRENLTAEQEAAYRQKLTEALEAGYAVLDSGKSSVQAVRTAIRIMENSPLFNAGRGAVFTARETNEMDASIMEGTSLNAGAVAGVSQVKNPIEAAHLVMRSSPHVLLSGSGADQFAEAQGLTMALPEYFKTERRLQHLRKLKQKDSARRAATTFLNEDFSDHKFGTVGCVALDKKGNLAAGTSTGGMTNKRYGRIGDSPIIGAGTYADNATCAVSATGHGEYFIRYAVAHRISALMRYGGVSLQAAADSVVHGVLVRAGGSGGVIAISKQGHIALPFNTAGMYRAYRREGEEPQVRIFGGK